MTSREATPNTERRNNMTLKDFYIANDMISDFSEITVHLENDGSYSSMTVNPLEAAAFNYYLGYIVTNFRMDGSGHWHLQITRN
jgi:hypothetical protein